MIAASLRHSCGILAACLGHPMILVPMILVPMILVPMILVACGRLLCIRQISFRRALRGAQVQGGGIFDSFGCGVCQPNRGAWPLPLPLRSVLLSLSLLPVGDRRDRECRA